MGNRKIADAQCGLRCQWDRKLTDASAAQCGRKHVDGEFCAQHAKMAAANPDMSDPVVKLAAQMVVDSFGDDDMARVELRDGIFDVGQMQPADIFRVLVRSLRGSNQQELPNG